MKKVKYKTSTKKLIVFFYYFKNINKVNEDLMFNEATSEYKNFKALNFSVVSYKFQYTFWIDISMNKSENINNSSNSLNIVFKKS